MTAAPCVASQQRPVLLALALLPAAQVSQFVTLMMRRGCPAREEPGGWTNCLQAPSANRPSRARGRWSGTRNDGEQSRAGAGGRAR